MTMLQKFRINLSDKHRLFSPIGLALIDEFTSEPPFGKLRVRLEIDRDGTNQWEPTDIRAKVNSHGVVFFPGLGRRVHVSSPPQITKFRVSLDAEFYRPFYFRELTGAQFTDGLTFDSQAYNDAQPLPASDVVGLPKAEDDFRLLLPAVNYPFESHIRVVRGIVTTLEVSPKPLRNALVSSPNKERVITDERGEFVLPLRWAPVAMFLENPANAGANELTLNRTDGLSTSVKLKINGNEFSITAVTLKTVKISPVLPGALTKGTAVLPKIDILVEHKRLAAAHHHTLVIPDDLKKVQKIQVSTT